MCWYCNFRAQVFWFCLVSFLIILATLLVLFIDGLVVIFNGPQGILLWVLFGVVIVQIVIMLVGIFFLKRHALVSHKHEYFNVLKLCMDTNNDYFQSKLSNAIARQQAILENAGTLSGASSLVTAVQDLESARIESRINSDVTKANSHMGDGGVCEKLSTLISSHKYKVYAWGELIFIY